MTGGYYKPNLETGNFDYVDPNGNVSDSGISWLGQGLTVVDMGSYYWLCNVVELNPADDSKALKNIKVAKGLQVGSIVYRPAEYYQGIQSIQVDAFRYIPLDLFDAKPQIDQTAKTDGRVPGYSDEYQFSFVPNVVMRYYVNPKNAFLDMNDKSKYSFVVTDSKYTRTFTDNDLEIKSVNQEFVNGVPTGLFTVTAKAAQDRDKDIKILNSSEKSGSVTVAALRYTDYTEEEEPTAVVSDFAALRHNVVTNFGIYFNDGNLVASTPADAKKTVLFQLPYDSGTIDLNEYFSVKYTSADEKGAVVFTKQKMIDTRFELQFEQIGFVAGDEKTVQADHCSVTTDGKFTPVDAPASAGRTPIVRVKLVDTNNNQVAAVAYAKIMLVKPDIKPLVIKTPITLNKSYVLSCSQFEFSNFEMKWKDMEAILNEVGLSKTQFDDKYVLDSGSDKVAYQYDKVAENMFNRTHNSFGVVTGTEGEESHETNILKWTIGNDEAYRFVDYYGIGAKKDVIVKFVPRNPADMNVLRPIYVTLSWIVGENSKITPSVEIINSEHKARASWDKDYTHALAYVSKSDCEFNITALTPFNNDPLNIVKGQLRNDGYGKLADAASMKYKFNGASANGYKFEVKYEDDYQRVYAVKGNKAYPVVEFYTDEDGNPWKLRYVNDKDGSGVATEILNSAEEPLTVTIEMNAKTCAPAENLIQFKNKSNIYDMKFIRPMTIKDASSKNINDASDAVIESKVTMTFVDWQKNVFKKDNGYYSLYEIESIEQNGAIQYTWATEGFTNVDKSKFDIQYVGPKTVNGYIDGTDFGKVTYKNINGIAIVNPFKVKVPVVVNYKWGKLKTTFEFEVGESK